MLDPASSEVRRFLTGPRGYEVTGATQAADRRSTCVNIQHSGERNDPAYPKPISAWRDGATGLRPRSATLAIRHTDGGSIGS